MLLTPFPWQAVVPVEDVSPSVFILNLLSFTPTPTHPPLPQAVVPVEDVSPSVFLLLLDHLYTDAADVTPDSALDLLAAADRFGVERLKQLCSAQIEAGLSVDSVCEVLTMADRHSEAELVRSCVSFIVAHFSEVRSPPTLPSFPKIRGSHHG
jgi:hypothetical protein